MRDRLDELVDEALKEYAGEPRVGLERRVLHRVRTEGGRRWLVWAPLFAAVALVCAVVFVRPGRVPVEVRRVEAHVVKSADEKAASIKPAKTVRRRVVLPKQEMFPAPSPLSSEERALLALAKWHPETAGEVSQTGLEPIEIQLLEIKPLQIESGQ